MCIDMSDLINASSVNKEVHYNTSVGAVQISETKQAVLLIYIIYNIYQQVTTLFPHQHTGRRS